jgi:hypothetical protein
MFAVWIDHLICERLVSLVHQRHSQDFMKGSCLPKTLHIFMVDVKGFYQVDFHGEFPRFFSKGVVCIPLTKPLAMPIRVPLASVTSGSGNPSYGSILSRCVVRLFLWLCRLCPRMGMMVLLNGLFSQVRIIVKSACVCCCNFYANCAVYGSLSLLLKIGFHYKPGPSTRLAL